MMKKAITMVELILVIALLGIAVGFSILYHQTSQVRADVNSQTSTLVSYMRLAQTKAMSGKNNTSHGIHLESDAYTLFEGASYSPSDPDNIVMSLPSTIAIQTIALNGGGSDVIFSPPHGETTTYGSFDMTSGQINKTLPITISSFGTITY